MMVSNWKTGLVLVFLSLPTLAMGQEATHATAQEGCQAVRYLRQVREQYPELVDFNVAREQDRPHLDASAALGQTGARALMMALARGATAQGQALSLMASPEHLATVNGALTDVTLRLGAVQSEVATLSSALEDLAAKSVRSGLMSHSKLTTATGAIDRAAARQFVAELDRTRLLQIFKRTMTSAEMDRAGNIYWQLFQNPYVGSGATGSVQEAQVLAESQAILADSARVAARAARWGQVLSRVGQTLSSVANPLTIAMIVGGILTETRSPARNFGSSMDQYYATHPWALASLRVPAGAADPVCGYWVTFRPADDEGRAPTPADALVALAARTRVALGQLEAGAAQISRSALAQSAQPPVGEATQVTEPVAPRVVAQQATPVVGASGPAMQSAR